MRFIISILITIIVIQFIVILYLYKRRYLKYKYRKALKRAYKSKNRHVKVYADTDSVISKDTSSIYPNVMKGEKYGYCIKSECNH